jgi:outer membrane protein
MPAIRTPSHPFPTQALRWLLPCLAIATANASAQSPVGLLDAVTQTVASHPEVRLRQDDVAVARGDLLEAQGQFDSRLTTAAQVQRGRQPQFFQLGLAADSLFYTSHASVTNYDLFLEKQLRTGQLLRPTVQVDRSAQSIAGVAPTGEDTRVTLPGENRTIVSLQLQQPLMRGRGRDAVTALEHAAEISVDASTSTLQHAIASVVLRTAASYWNYVGAVRQLEIARTAETRAQALLDETTAVIAAGVQPESDVKLVQATLANRRATRIGFDQSALSAKHELVLASGGDAADAARMGQPSDPIPALPSPDAWTHAGLDALVAAGLKRRSDLVAATERESQLRTLTTAARDAARPDLALTVDAGYVGLSEGRSLVDYFNSLRRLDGFNASASVAYRFPLGNHAALGQLARTEAAARQGSTRRQDLVRTITSNIIVAWNDVRSSAERVEQARQASTLYRATVSDERMKVQLGLSTVLDLIVTEDRLVQSLREEVAAEVAYATAVARLRFETGTLVGPDGSVTYDRLTTIPATDRP